jgi:hypothetical protein
MEPANSKEKLGLDDFAYLPYATGASQEVKPVSTGTVFVQDLHQGIDGITSKEITLYARDNNCLKPEGCLLYLPAAERKDLAKVAELDILGVKHVIDYRPERLF